MAHKVLIVAYYWPPAGGPGVQRWLKFVKYLPQFKVEPIVFVPENPNYPLIDDSLLEDIPNGLTTIKYPIKEPYGLASMLSRKQTKNISSGILPKQGKETFLQKVMLYVRGNYFVPDARIGWVRSSATFLKDYIEENNIETIITTGPPHSLHLIGKRLKSTNHSLKWLADFRDPWTSIGYHDKLRMTPKTKRRHKALEKEVLSEADQIIVTSPLTKKEFEQITSKPIEVITNGFDREITQVKKEDVNRDSFVLGHFGSFLSDRNPQILWQVLSELTHENKAFAQAFTLKLAGKVSQEIFDSLEEHDLSKYLDFIGYVSHNKLVDIYKETDYLLLVEINTEHTKAIIPGKLFDYLAAQKPIIAIGPEGSDVQDIITKTASGTYFTYEAKNTLKEHIRSLFEHKDLAHANLNVIAQYHRKALTERIALLISSKS